MDDFAQKELIAVLADDLTGAADTGIQFLCAEKPAYLLSGSELDDVCFTIPPDVLSVYTQSRTFSGTTAARIVGKAAAKLETLKPGLLYKKLDSCLRGNIGEELDAILKILHIPTCFFAPALPDQGRITIHGIHYLHGVPVAETEMARDPVSPVNDSDLVHFLAKKSRYRIGRIDVDDYVHGVEFIRNKVQTQLDQDYRYIIFDAVEQYHLDMVAKLGLSFFSEAMFTGSAGLAASVASILKRGISSSQKKQPSTLAKSNMLWLCGSASEKTAEQVERLLAESNCTELVLEAGMLAKAMGDAQLHLATKAAKILKKDSLIIHLSPRQKNRYNYDPEQVLQGLSRLTTELLRLQRPACLFLSGGDTADAVLYGTGMEYIRLEQELIPGIVLGRCFGGLLDQIPVVTKAGSFGDADILLQVFQKLFSKKITIK